MAKAKKKTEKPSRRGTSSKSGAGRRHSRRAGDAGGITAGHWTAPFFIEGADYRGDDGVLLRGSADLVLPKFPADSFDLVFTDPDYSSGRLRGYQIAAENAHILKKDGFLVVEAPHEYAMAIDAVIQHFGGRLGLRFWWLGGWYQLQGSHPRMVSKAIEVMFKPLLFYRKGSPSRRGKFIKDMVEVTRTKEKGLWQKDVEGYKYYIDRLCPADGCVLDPFVGHGTTALAAQSLGRRFVCIDIDAQKNEKTAQELEKHD